MKLACNTHPGLGRSRKENRYFELFQHNTILGLMGFDRGSSFWNYTVLQVSQASPAVLHAALALSALHEHLDRDPTRKTESFQLSLLEYNKSIGYLRSRQSNLPVQFTLICCILFICLENAQGSYDGALTHLRNGLSILQDWKTNTSMSGSGDKMMEDLTLVFRRLDMQATVFLDSRQPELNATSRVQSPKSDHSVPECFSSMQDAQTSLEEIELRLFYVLTTKSMQHHSFESHDKMLAARAPLLRGLAGRFRKWKEAFDSFSKRESEKLQPKDVRLGVLLALHYETTSYMLDTKSRSNPDMETILTWESTLTRINNLCRSLIKSSSSSAKFAADTGVIAPLYYSAMRATSSPVRLQAIEILRSVRWKEGFWDAETAARIAENVSDVKRSGMTSLPVTGGIPDLAKAHCVVTCF